MYYPSKAVTRQVQQNADHGTPLMRGNFLIPLKKEIDLTLRPQEIYRRICSSERPAGFSFLLESCRTHPKTGRFSFVGSQPFLIFKSKARNIHIIKNGRTKGFLAHPIKVLRSLLNGHRSIKIPGISGFTGGAVGYFSYDCCHLFEKLPKTAKDDLGLPDIFLIFVDTVAAYDHLENKLVLISNIYPDKPLDEAYEEAVERIERLEEEIRQPSRGGC